MKIAKLFPFTTRASVPAVLPGYANELASAQTFYQPFYLSNGSLLSAVNASNPLVTQQGLLGLAPAWAALNMISHAVATMLTSADIYDESGIEVLPKPIIATLPNPFYSSSYEYFTEVVNTLLIYGNYIAVIYEDSLIPVHPSLVECRITDAGRPVYKIGEGIYSQDEILHVRGLTMPGTWWGIGVIEAQRKSLTTSIDMQNYSATTYRTGGVPTAVIGLDSRNVAPEVLTDIASQWQTAFSGGNRKPVVMPQGMSVTPLAWTPEDSQYLQSRQFDVAEIALMFGLNPSDLTATIGGSNLTYANLSEVNLERIKRSYAPWVIRIECAWEKVLPAGYTMTANPEALLRMDTKSRYESYATAIGSGWLTIDEVRAIEHLDPLPPTNKELPS